MKRIFSFLFILSVVTVNAQDKPSFFALRGGVSFPLGAFGGHDLEKSTFAMPGVSMGAEGAWFFKPYLGVGAHAGLNFHPIDVGWLGAEKVAADPSLEDMYIRSEAFRTITFSAGFYGNWPIWKSMKANAKILGGLLWAQTPHQLYQPQYFMGIGPDYYQITSSTDYSFVMIYGAGISYPLSPCIGLKLDAEFLTKEAKFGFNRSGIIEYDKKRITFLNVSLGLVVNL